MAVQGPRYPPASTSAALNRKTATYRSRRNVWSSSCRT